MHEELLSPYNLCVDRKSIGSTQVKAAMKKIKNESELLKEAIRVGTRYFEARGAGTFETTDHVDNKVRALYLLLVKDGVIQPLAMPDESVLHMRHKLAIWISKNLPADHHLLQ
ncbi:MAG: hypothetical protein ACI80L_002066 [Pseudohongiellaceae bacterium]